MFILRTILASALACTALASPVPGTATPVIPTGTPATVPGIFSLSQAVLSGGGQLINLNVAAGLLGASNCSTTSKTPMVGISTQSKGVTALGMSLGSTKVCACVATTSSPNAVACPACPKNSSATCGGANCGCTCNTGYYAYSDPTTGVQSCVADATCSTPNNLAQLSNGRSTCQCARGFMIDFFGGCESACLASNQ